MEFFNILAAWKLFLIATDTLMTARITKKEKNYKQLFGFVYFGSNTILHIVLRIQETEEAEGEFFWNILYFNFAACINDCRNFSRAILINHLPIQLCPDNVHFLGFFLKIVFLSLFSLTILLVLFLFLMLVVDVFYFFFDFYCSLSRVESLLLSLEGKFTYDRSLCFYFSLFWAQSSENRIHTGRQKPMNELFTRKKIVNASIIIRNELKIESFFSRAETIEASTEKKTTMQRPRANKYREFPI
jgi:hypothetical protein